uniref:Large ribosomal subunit protein uL22c n=1 Tax=Thuretia quercifolia TaxID=189650 RepID=A0A1Z1ML49_9FLOR|nr:ribosomal protein L22 [Thuretia quercifolia]ARW66464.1 ribosomal protein L22 [Thuretia quercifolia]
MSIKEKSSKAIGKYLRISTHKARRILEQIKGKKYNDAKLILKFMPYRACKNINKILESAFSNIQQKNIEEINKNKIFIKEAIADQGPTLKRFQPRAQGRAFPIRKPTCHITIEIEIN